MIRSVKVVNDQNESLEMILDQPELSEFIVESIDGLGPENATINSNELATSDGATFSSARKATKPITLNLKFYPEDGNVERIRHRCYRYFTVKKKVRLYFQTDERYVYIDGFVESNTPDIFSNQEGASISVVCMQPYFIEVAATNIVMYGIDDRFEFPYSNDSISENLTILGEYMNIPSVGFLNGGEYECGMIIKITFEGLLDRVLNIINTTNNQKLPLDFRGTSYSAGTIVIDTVFGEKDVYLKSGTNITSLKSLIVRDSNTAFPQLEVGFNQLIIDIPEELVTNLSIEYHKLYGGV